MLSRFSKLVIMVFLLSVLPSNFQVANSNVILWGPSFGNELYTPPNLPPSAKIRSVQPLVYQSNPDEMIFKIVMADSFEDKPFTNKGRYLGLNIFVGNIYCVNTNITADDKHCERVQTVSNPESPSSYPTSKSSEWVYIYDREVTFGPKRVATSCKAPWWIESTYRSRDTWAFAISITCLNLPKEFGFYGVSEVNLGQKEVAYTTSSTIAVEYPFHELAAKAYKKPTDLSALNLLEKKSQYISDSLNKLKSANNKSKLKNKSQNLKQINQIIKSADNNTILLNSAKKSGNNDPNLLNKINIYMNSMIAQINAMSRLLKLPPIKTDIIEYTVFLDKAVYQKGETAKIFIKGRDLYGIDVADGTPLAFSNNDINFYFLSLNIFKNTPVFSDVSAAGLWQYELVIGVDIGTHKITFKIGNNAEQTLNYGVK
jgi:hypothetical protein